MQSFKNCDVSRKWRHQEGQPPRLSSQTQPNKGLICQPEDLCLSGMSHRRSLCENTRSYREACRRWPTA